MTVEVPVYNVSLKDGACEIRDYPSLITAEVSVSGERETAIAAGFRLLAIFIFGGNVREQKISMTAPVVQSPQPEKVAMTTPAIQQAAGTAWIVRFIMPRGFTLRTLPAPTNPKVHLVALPATRFAIIRFTGLTQAGDIAKQIKRLETFIEKRHLHVTGVISLARYDPAWRFWFLRHNELMVPIT